jgi:hypothetical protein
MPRAKLFFSEAFRSIGANLSTTVAATMTVLIGMFLLGLFIALFSWVNSWTDHVRKDVVVKVFFEQSPRPPNRRSMPSGEDQDVPGNEDGRMGPEGRGLKRMTAKYPELIQGLVGNPLPDAFEVTPKDADQVSALANRLNPLPPGVEKVDYAQKKTERILSVTNVIKYIFLLGSVILMIASTILIANTIRLSIFSRTARGRSDEARRSVELVRARAVHARGDDLRADRGDSRDRLAHPREGGSAPCHRGAQLDLQRGDVHALSFPLTALILLGVALAVAQPAPESRCGASSGSDWPRV